MTDTYYISESHMFTITTHYDLVTTSMINIHMFIVTMHYDLVWLQSNIADPRNTNLYEN